MRWKQKKVKETNTPPIFFFRQMTSTIFLCFGAEELTVNRVDYLLFDTSSSPGFCMLENHTCGYPSLTFASIQNPELSLIKHAVSFDPNTTEITGEIQGRFDMVETVIMYYFGAVGDGLSRWSAFKSYLIALEDNSVSNDSLVSFFIMENHLLIGGVDIDTDQVIANTNFPVDVLRLCAIRMDPFYPLAPNPNTGETLVGYGLPSSVLTALNPNTLVIAGPAAAHLVAPQITIPAIDLHVLDVAGADTVVDGLVVLLRAAGRIISTKTEGAVNYLVAVAPSDLIQVNILRTRAKDIETVLRGFGTVAYQACFDGTNVHITGAAGQDHANYTTSYTYITEDTFPDQALPSGVDIRRDVCLNPGAPTVVQDSVLAVIDLERCPEQVDLDEFFYTYVHSLHRSEWFGTVANAIANLEPVSVMPLCVVRKPWSPDDVLRVKIIRPSSRALFAASLLASNLIDGKFLEFQTTAGQVFESPVEWHSQGQLLANPPSVVEAWTIVQLRCKITYDENLASFQMRLESVFIVL